jgi:hypothetical protein
LIVKKEDYINRFAVSGERAEMESLGAKLQELLEAAGWADEYEEEIDYADLPEYTQKEIDELNLVDVLQEQIFGERIDPIVSSFVLHRLKQLGISEASTLVLFRFRWKWRRRSPSEVKERTHEETTEAIRAGRALISL